MKLPSYDKTALRGLGIKEFLSEVDVRNKYIEQASDELPPKTYAVNQVARKLHPDFQFGVITDVVDYGTGKQYTIAADPERGTNELATFRAGQYVSVILMMDGHPTTRTYHLCGSPKDALGQDGTYTLMVNTIPNRKACFWIHENWQIGTKINMSGPQGNMYYQKTRDTANVLGIGSNGVFYAMGRAINDGLEDFNLTIIYPSFGAAPPPFVTEQEQEIIEASRGRVRIIPVVYGPPTPDFANGPITAEFISQFFSAEELQDLTVLSDCNPAIEQALMAALAQLGVPKSRIHAEYSGSLDSPSDDPAYPLDVEKAKFMAKVHIRNEVIEVPCGGVDSLMVSIENAGINLIANCRSGICGYCHSRLISGKVFIPESKDGRREADKKFGWIHPCATYPLSDVELEVYPPTGYFVMKQQADKRAL